VGVTGYLIVTGAASADDEAAKTATATCTGGTKVIGGGFLFTNVSDPAVVAALASYPSSDTVWTVTTPDVTSGGDHSYSITAYAICANVAS
jgi:isocitrate lyase